MTATPDFYIKRGDTLPIIQGTLVDADDEPIDLTNADVRFKMRPVPPNKGGNINEEATVVGTASEGVARYTWQAGDLDDIDGDFWGEFEATLQGGGVVTCPNDGYFLIRITRDV